LLTRVACRTDWGQVRAGFVDLRWQYWLAAVLLLIFAQVVSAMRWKYYTDQLRLPRSLGQLTGFYFIGMYFNLMLPTSVGGDVVRAWYLDGQSGRRVPAFASVFLDRLNGLVVLVALACLAVTLSPLPLPSWIVISVWSIAACGLLGLAGLHLFVRRASVRRQRPEVGSQRSEVGIRSAEQRPLTSDFRPPTRMEQLRTTLALFCLPRVLAATLLLSLCVQAVNVLIVWLIGQAIGAPIPATYYWVMVPMVTLLTLLPISVNGMGVREEATVLFLAPLGIASGTALTLSVLWFAVSASVSLLGGAVYFLGHFPKPVTPAAVSLSPCLPFSRRQGDEEKGRQGESCGPLGGDSDQGRAGQHRHAA
jgi:hypothetical protein